MIRSQILYPAELRAHVVISIAKIFLYVKFNISENYSTMIKEGVMKVLKYIFILLVVVFTIVVLEKTILLVNVLSFGSFYASIALYFLLAICILYYLIRPLFKHYRIPTMAMLERSRNGDVRATRHILNYYDGIDGNSYREIISRNDYNEMFDKLREIIDAKSDAINDRIKLYAFSATSAVIISPNSMIDGISIIIANVRLIHSISKIIGIRYNGKELFTLYANSFFAGSLTGLLEEFDDTIEEIIEELIETTFEKSESTLEKLPIVNIAIKGISPIIQAAANYAYIVFNGIYFKKRVENIISDNKLPDDDLRYIARKEARKLKRKFITDTIKKAPKGSYKYITKKLGLD